MSQKGIWDRDTKRKKTFVNSLTLIRLDLQAKQPGEGFPVLTIVNLPKGVSLRKEKSSTGSYPTLSWRYRQRECMQQE